MLVALRRANEALKQRDAGEIVASLERSLEAEVSAKVTAQAAVEGALYLIVRHETGEISRFPTVAQLLRSQEQQTSQQYHVYCRKAV